MTYTYVCIYCNRDYDACRCRRNAKIAFWLFIVFGLAALIGLASS